MGPTKRHEGPSVADADARGRPPPRGGAAGLARAEKGCTWVTWKLAAAGGAAVGAAEDGGMRRVRNAK